MLAHVQFDGFGDPIQAQAVLLWVDFIQKAAFQCIELHGIDPALED